MDQSGATFTREALTVKLAGSIRELIHQDKLATGDRLPSVKSLAERFQVAAPTLREALRRLEATGTVDIRHGSGVYVHANAERLMLVNPHAPPLDLETVLELLDARLLIEPRLAEMAARRVTDEDIDELSAILSVAEAQLAATNVDDLVLQVANQRFHAKIASCGQNKVLGQLATSLHDLYLREQIEIFYLYDNPADDLDHHLTILEGLRNRAPDRSRDLMARHLTQVIEVVKRKNESRGGDTELQSP